MPAERSPASAGPLGAVLAGGGSRRMGRDKALLRWRGETLLGRAVRLLEAELEDVLVVGGVRQASDLPGVEAVPDDAAGLGPLGGLDTALARSGGRSVFLLACDLPLVSRELIRSLTDAGETAAEGGGAWAVAPTSPTSLTPPRDPGPQPLCALYAAACSEPLKAFLAAGHRSARAFLREIRTHLVELRPGEPGYSPGVMTNVNYPEDLARLSECSDVGGSAGERP